jgi:hypothetical protein
VIGSHKRNTGPMLTSPRCGAKTRSNLPAIGPDLNGTPTLVGKSEIDPAGMLSDAGIDDPLGAIKLRTGLRGD